MFFVQLLFYFSELEREEKKLEMEIKKAAKTGDKQVGAIKNDNLL